VSHFKYSELTFRQ